MSPIKFVKLQRNQVRDAVLEMGSYAVDATKQEIHNHHIAWMTDHWTGHGNTTYTTVTAHWIDDKTWMLKSAVLNFIFLKGRPLIRESMKMPWRFFRNIRVKPKTLLRLTQLVSSWIRQEIWGSYKNNSGIMEKYMSTVLTTICIWSQDWHLILRKNEILRCSTTTVSSVVSSNIIWKHLVFVICSSNWANSGSGYEESAWYHPIL